MSRLGNPPPGTPGSPVRRRVLHSRTVLGGKGSLRRGIRRALASCAPFRSTIHRDGRLRREPDIQRFLCLNTDKDQVLVDETS